jgi:hypothetical protein
MRIPKMSTLVTWSGYLTAAIYLLFFIADCIIHFLQGYTTGTHERGKIMAAQHDCEFANLRSEMFAANCAQILSTPLPVPWHTAVHYTARHLALKMTSALQCALLLLVVGAFVFWVTTKWLDPRQGLAWLKNGFHYKHDYRQDHQHDNGEITTATTTSSSMPRSVVYQFPSQAHRTPRHRRYRGR